MCTGSPARPRSRARVSTRARRTCGSRGSCAAGAEGNFLDQDESVTPPYPAGQQQDLHTPL